MKYILTLLLLTVAGSAFAQTGIFYDRTIRGEGVTVYEHEAVDGTPFRTFYFYTYGDEQCELDSYTVDHRIQREVVAEAIAECPNSIFPPFHPLCDPVVVRVVELIDEIVTLPAVEIDCDDNGQRWFLGTNQIITDVLSIPENEGLQNGDSIGRLFITEGVNFPTCIPSLEPFEDDVDICGVPKAVGAYILRPAKEGGFYMWVESNSGDHVDPLFDHAYEFTTALVEYPPVAEPKD